MLAWLHSFIYVKKLPPDITRNRTVTMLDIDREITMKPVNREITMKPASKKSGA